MVPCDLSIPQPTRRGAGTRAPSARARAFLCASESKDGAERGRAGTGRRAAHSTGMVVVLVVVAPKIGRNQTVLGLVQLPQENE